MWSLLVTNVETMFVPPSSPMVNINIEFYEQNLRTEKSDPIDTMLKVQTQKINSFWRIL